MTLAQVAKRAGVSKGMVTYWFKSKDELFVEALQRFHARYETDLMKIATEPMPARARLEALLLAAFPSQEQVAREVRFHAEVWSYAKENPEVQAAIVQNYGHFRMACEALLGLGVAEGYVDPTRTAGLYRYIHALIDGLSLHVAFDPDVDMAEVRARLLTLLERWFQD